MDAEIRGETHRFYDAGVLDPNGVGRKGFEWDLNDWCWNGDACLATPLTAGPSRCRGKTLFPVQSHEGPHDQPRELGSNHGDGVMFEKRRKIIVVQEDEPEDRVGTLALKLGRNVDEDYAVSNGVGGKRSKGKPSSSNRGMCQVEGCVADLADAKDYHRRHKVCEMHAKASRALVGNAIQRFCQQCSRFHLLQEFDEGKRSCRRRLAGHNKRRRKTNSSAVANGNSLTATQDNNNLLITLLRILSNLPAPNSSLCKDIDLLSHFLRSLAGLVGSFDARNLSSLIEASQNPMELGHSAGASLEAVDPSCSDLPELSRIMQIDGASPAIETPQTNAAEHLPDENVPAVQCQTLLHISGLETSPRYAGCFKETQHLPATTSIQGGGSSVDTCRMKSFDLNDVYEDGKNDDEESEKVGTFGALALQSPSSMLQESHLSSPPRASGSSDSASAKSLATSNGDVQTRTDRIVFKLFGKDPNDFPVILRSQIVNWLSNTPTDIESYIRPGCIILTVYLRLPECKWEEISCKLSSSLRRLMDLTNDHFWRTGWVYARVEQRMAFIFNGQTVLEGPLLLNGYNHCKILSVTPIAVPVSGKVKFTIRGFNLSQATMRLFCAFEGKYLIQEETHTLVGKTNMSNLNDSGQCLSFSCSLPNASGRGFIEVEDLGLNGTFFPFIVAEQEICSEIRTLESTISDDSFRHGCSEMEIRKLALDFLHEMGWLLRWCNLRSKTDSKNIASKTFSLARFKWLMEFSMEHDWCAVVRKLLDVFLEGAVDVGSIPVDTALEEMYLLHTAVHKNSRLLVKLLLEYTPGKVSSGTRSRETKASRDSLFFLFRPDTVNLFGVTPLHVAASRSGTESVLDALTDDPRQVGMNAWNTVCDRTGFTPADYARSRGFASYIVMVEQKVKKSIDGHVVVDIPRTSGVPEDVKKQNMFIPGKLAGFEIGGMELKPMSQPYCKACSQQQLVYMNRNRSSSMYRPAMLSLMAVAVVCVCVGLLLKGPPEVRFVSPFRWELLHYGAM